MKVFSLTSGEDKVFFTKWLNRFIVLFLCIFLLIGCSPIVKQSPLPETPLEFKKAISMLTNHLLTQLKNHNVTEKSVNLVYSPFIDTDSGQVLQVSLDIRNLFIRETNKNFTNFRINKFTPSNLAQANYVVDGIIRYERQTRQKYFHVDAMIVDLKNQTKVAGEDVWIADRNLNIKPTPSSKDNPTYVKDNALDALMSAVRSPVGTKVSHIYSTFLETKSMLVEAQTAYDNSEYTQALRLFNAIERRPNGKVVSTYGGLYSIYFRLGKLKEAERSFGKMVAVGVESDSLPVKLVFESASTKFLNNQELLQQYDIWLKQVTMYLRNNRNKCAYVVGHTSKSYPPGKPEFNCKLSKNRAGAIQKRMGQISRSIKSRLRVIGMGSRETIIGTEPDDDHNAIDRRVEFKVVNCSSPEWRQPARGCLLSR